MALDIYTNIYSTVAQNNLNVANSSLSKSIERLSSGLRINHASDDASGLAISEKLRGQIRGLAKATMNAQDAISFLQTAEGGMETIGDMIQRMRELAVQAGNGSYTTTDRRELQKEVDQLKQEINRVSASTEFNTKKLLTGEASALWSTSDPKNLTAIIKGAPSEGNYKISLSSTGGLNYVYKTNIFNTATGIATKNTLLKDIKQFTNPDGRNILDSTEELTLVGNNSSVTITMEGGDKLGDFVTKLNNAIKTLGMGAVGTAATTATVNSSLAVYVTANATATTATASNNFKAVAGTIVFQGAIVGKNSKINFIGDQSIINAIGITQLQSGKDTDLNVTVTDAHTNKEIGKDTISDNILRGIIKGVDVEFSNPTRSATYNTASGSIGFSGSATSNYYLHIADNHTSAQIGANEGQLFDISIGELNTRSLEIDDSNVLTFEDSQKAITKFDQALTKVSSARATIGAQVNRLEYTLRNLAISRQNLVAAEARIRDLDIAEESATFANNQIRVNAAVAILAQANQLPQAALQLLGR